MTTALPPARNYQTVKPCSECGTGVPTTASANNSLLCVDCRKEHRRAQKKRAWIVRRPTGHQHHTTKSSWIVESCPDEEFPRGNIFPGQQFHYTLSYGYFTPGMILRDWAGALYKVAGECGMKQWLEEL